MLACIELAEMLRAGLSLFTVFHRIPLRGSRRMNLGPIEFLFQLMKSVITDIATGTQLS
jgi:hypothetical protein